MDNKITKERVDRHLEYDWYKYLLLILAAILIWTLIFSVTDNIPEDKKLSFITVNCTVEDSISQKIENDKSNLLGSDNTIEEFSFNAQYDVDNLSLIMQTSGMISDFFIAPAEIFAVYSKWQYFFDFDVLISDGYFTAEELEVLTLTDAFYVTALTEEEKQSIDKDTADSIDNKKFGINLNKLGNSILFKTVYSIDEETETETEVEYILGIIRPNLTNYGCGGGAGSGGGNKGKYNANKQDIENIDSFKFIKGFLTKNPNGLYNFDKYRAVV